MAYNYDEQMLKLRNFYVSEEEHIILKRKEYESNIAALMAELNKLYDECYRGWWS